MFNIRSFVLAITLALTTLTATGCKSCASTSETEAGADATVTTEASVDASPVAVDAAVVVDASRD